jgi:hypothetical protein
MYGPVQIERDVFEAFTAQVLALRSDELAQRRGGWLYLQIVHTPSRWRLGSSRLTLERAYDHLPAWWGLSPFSGDRLTDLAEEIEGREPAFRPEWARLLDPAVAAEFR